MKRILPLLLLFSWCFFFFNQPTSKAATLSGASLRLNRTAPNSALSGLLCATPSNAGAGTEGKVSITFPSNFTINTTTTNWTTSTTNIPSGATAWPGIGSTAQTVSGKTVTFASSDLNSMSKYCFELFGSSSTTGSSGTEVVNVSTKTASNTTIDQSEVTINIGNDQVTLQATVPASGTDYTAILEGLKSGNYYPEDTVLDYRISYSSALPYPTNVTLVATWTQGTIDGYVSPSIDTLAYITGSASKAYNNTPPVIDVINRTITWTIINLPGDSYPHYVSFDLRTLGNYTGAKPVQFTVTANLNGPGVSTPNSSVVKYYWHSSYGPTPTPGPTNSPTPTIPIPTPTPKPMSLRLSTINISAISDTSATILAHLSEKAKSRIFYGTSISALNKSLTDASATADHSFLLTDLTPDTTYFFVVQALDSYGRSTSTDIFTFKTARVSEAPQIKKTSIVVTSRRSILLSNIPQDTQKLPTVVIPIDTPYEFQFSLSDDRVIRLMQARIDNANVLGLSTLAYAEQAVTMTHLAETSAGTFSGSLISPQTPGDFILTTRIQDSSGNLKEEPLVKLRFINPFKVLQEHTKKPIEKASILLSLYNPKTRIFEKLSGLGIGNPLYTDPDGTAQLVLPMSTYRATISSIGSQEKEVTFVIGPHTGEDYPTITLTKDPFSIVNSFNYFLTAFQDTNEDGVSFFQTMRDSSRFFDLLTLCSLLLLIILSFFSIFSRVRFHPFSLQQFLKRNNSYKDNQATIKIVVTNNQTNNPVAYAIVKIGRLRLYTDKNGIGIFPQPEDKEITLSVKKYGYVKLSQTLSLTKQHQLFRVMLQPHTSHHPIIETGELVVRMFTNGLVEVFLLGSILISFSLGIKETLPLFILCIGNCFLWLIHLKDMVIKQETWQQYEEA